MARLGGGFHRNNDFAAGGGFVNRLNRILFPWIGPPPLGPYDQETPPPARERGCPLCGSPMAGHTKALSDGRTILHCP
jgi:hypothetical protein